MRKYAKVGLINGFQTRKPNLETLFLKNNVKNNVKKRLIITVIIVIIIMILTS